jgi:C4-dicarboxylate-specific signal transduction histidine kinase
MGEKFEDIVEQMAEQSYRASEIIRRVRSFIKKGEQEKEPIDVNETIQTLSGLLLADASDHDSDITFEMADDLPEVVANPFQLQQVVLNLVHNGIEAMSESKVTNPRLIISTRFLEFEGIEVSVRNKSKSLEIMDTEKVFEPFYTTKATGLGMGLAICRSIIEDHGGSLSVNSNHETGTSFQFTLPVSGKVKGESGHDN